MDIVNMSTGVCRMDNTHVKLAKSGDKAAFADLIDAHRLTLYRVAKGMLDSNSMRRMPSRKPLFPPTPISAVCTTTTFLRPG